MFENREQAGRLLADRLARDSFPSGLVLGVPRGGVAVAAPVAERLGLPLDIIIPRKVGAPHNPEVAVGAVTEDGTAIWDRMLLDRLGLRETDLEPLAAREVAEIKRRSAVYRGGRPRPDLAGRTVLLVDDGVATGSTMLAALRSVRRGRPRTVVLAVPVAPSGTLARLAAEVDRVVCLQTPAHFYAVGQFYRDFGQTTDEEVIRLLQRSTA